MKTITPVVALALVIAACGTPASPPATMAPPTDAIAPSVPPTAENPSASQSPGETPDADVAVAAQMANLLYDLEAVREYYEDGTTAMAVQAPQTSSLSRIPVSRGKLAAPAAGRLILLENVPSEFLGPLPADGAIAAPAGACPAAANPSVAFQTAAGETVTAQVLEQLGLRTIPMEMVLMAQSDPGSLVAKMDSLVPFGDPRLASAEGWNKLLWEPLQGLQTPAKSLMDYQLWNASPELEEQINTLYFQRLQAAGAPPIVLNAFNASHKSGWYANATPTPDDALAHMDIQAVMTGSVEGTVHEERSFSIPGAGQVPVFGPQTGEGVVTWEHPSLGTLTFDVDILLDQFDEKGRAIAGTVIGLDSQNGYEVRFVFKADGSKEGTLTRGGEVVGLMTMTTDAERFENYIDVQSEKALPLPEQ
jgi:hypothetical protein